MGNNDRLHWTGLAAQAVVLLALLWVGWQVRRLSAEDSVPMTRTTEWHAADGTTEQFTSTRERGQPFDVFREIHEQAVKRLKEPR